MYLASGISRSIEAGPNGSSHRALEISNSKWYLAILLFLLLLKMELCECFSAFTFFCLLLLHQLWIVQIHLKIRMIFDDSYLGSIVSCKRSYNQIIYIILVNAYLAPVPMTIWVPSLLPLPKISYVVQSSDLLYCDISREFYYVEDDNNWACNTNLWGGPQDKTFVIMMHLIWIWSPGE